MIKTRKELMIVDRDSSYELGGEYVECSLCRARGWSDEVVHERDCLLADPGVTHVRMAAVRARIVIHRSDGKYWWRGYDIERHWDHGYGTYFVMQRRSDGKVISDHARLRDIRAFIVDNQGVL